VNYRELAANAVLDQVTESIVNFAKILGPYFRELLEQGFDRDEAMEIVLDYQNLMLHEHGE